MDRNADTAGNTEPASEPVSDDRLGPVRSLRLRPEDDAEVLRRVGLDERNSVAYILRKLVEKGLSVDSDQAA